MPDVMMFPDTVEEFMESYKMVDVEHVYSNGVEYVPIYRMRQWFQHQPERKKGKWIQSEEKEGMEFTFYEIHCSECGVLRKIGWTGANFCPNCGADMRG